MIGNLKRKTVKILSEFIESESNGRLIIIRDILNL